MRQRFGANDTTYHPKALKAPLTAKSSCSTHLLDILIHINPKIHISFGAHHQLLLYCVSYPPFFAFVILRVFFTAFVRFGTKNREKVYYNSAVALYIQSFIRNPAITKLEYKKPHLTIFLILEIFILFILNVLSIFTIMTSQFQFILPSLLAYFLIRLPTNLSYLNKKIY